MHLVVTVAVLVAVVVATSAVCRRFDLSPPLVSGYVWNLGASLNCSSGELDFVEPLLGLDYWVIDCS